jgi:hypothetical protein
MTIAAMIVMTALVVVLVLDRFSLAKQADKRVTDLYNDWYSEREQWQKERAELLDRIQAPTFTEFKQQQTKQLKVVSGKAEQVPVEQQLL